MPPSQSPVTRPAQRVDYWSGWPTIGIVAIALMAMGLVTILANLAIFISTGGTDLSRLVEWTIARPIPVNGQMIIYWSSAAVGLLLIGAFIRRRHDVSLTDYLGLHLVAPGTVIKWLAGTGVFYTIFVFLPTVIAAQSGIALPAGRPATPYFISIVMFAPLVEEVIFRGFMLPGLMHSRAKISGAIFLTTIIWTTAHMRLQVNWISDLHGLGIIFCFGILLAVARIRTGSVFLPMVLHSSWNALVIIVNALIIAFIPTH